MLYLLDKVSGVLDQNHIRALRRMKLGTQISGAEHQGNCLASAFIHAFKNLFPFVADEMEEIHPQLDKGGWPALTRIQDAVDDVYSGHFESEYNKRMGLEKRCEEGLERLVHGCEGDAKNTLIQVLGSLKAADYYIASDAMRRFLQNTPSTNFDEITTELFQNIIDLPNTIDSLSPMNGAIGALDRLHIHMMDLQESINIVMQGCEDADPIAGLTSAINTKMRDNTVGYFILNMGSVLEKIDREFSLLELYEPSLQYPELQEKIMKYEKTVHEDILSLTQLHATSQVAQALRGGDKARQ